MLVYDVMTKGAECTRPNATLQEAAWRMKDLNIGALRSAITIAWWECSPIGTSPFDRWPRAAIHEPIA
jgi:hypothetical protein